MLQLPDYYSFGKVQVLIHGLYFWMNLQHTWNHNELERALVVSLGTGVCKTSHSTIMGLPCQGVFPGIFEHKRHSFSSVVQVIPLQPFLSGKGENLGKDNACFRHCLH